MDKGKTFLNVGDPAPDFCGTDEKGNKVCLGDFTGKKLVLFFYPKDDTPGCTIEVCNLRDNYDLLLSKSIVLLGISADDAAKHQHFIHKFNLPFPLLADTDLVIVNKYGVWGPKQLFGHDFDGIYRTTFVINERGVILDIIHEVNVNEHAQQIIDSFNKE